MKHFSQSEKSTLTKNAADKFEGFYPLMENFSMLFEEFSYEQINSFIVHAPENGEDVWYDYLGHRKAADSPDGYLFSHYVREILHQQKATSAKQELPDTHLI